MSSRTGHDLRPLLAVELYALTALWGVVQVLAPESALLYFVCAFGMASCATLWAVTDARRNNRPLMHIVQLLMLFTWPLALPLYLVWSRRMPGLRRAAVHFVGLMVTLCVFFYATALIR